MHFCTNNNLLLFSQLIFHLNQSTANENCKYIKKIVNSVTKCVYYALFLFSKTRSPAEECHVFIYFETV